MFALGTGRAAHWLQESQDSVDYVSLDELASLPPSELVLLELPPPWRPGRRYRCLTRTSLSDYAATTAQLLAVRDEQDATRRFLVPTYLPGVDIEDRDFEFMARFLAQEPACGRPTVFHVKRLIEAPKERVYGARDSSVYIHEIAEAQWERELWQLFDQAFMPGTTICPEGHELQRYTAEARNGYIICDHCERYLSRMHRYRCAYNCEFDLCEECFGSSHAGQRVVVDRVRALEQRLAEFWDEHQDFRLPQEPPRISPQTGHLSSAVTKWNRFSMEGDTKMKLRAMFLQSLQAHGANTALLRMAFWPGCWKEYQIAEFFIVSELKDTSPAALFTDEGDAEGRRQARLLVAKMGPAFDEDLTVEMLRSVTGAVPRDAPKTSRCTRRLWPVLPKAVRLCASAGAAFVMARHVGQALREDSKPSWTLLVGTAIVVAILHCITVRSR